MATLAALLGTLGGVTSSAAKAKEELAAEDLRKKQIYSQLESQALSREHVKALIDQMKQNPTAREVAQIEATLGRPLTDIEKQRLFKVAPKEQAGKVATKLIQDPASKTGWSFVSYDPLSGVEYSRQQDAPPQRGLIESETTTTDPLTNTTVVTHRRPLIGGGRGAATQPAPAAATPKGPITLSDLFPTPQAPRKAGGKARAGKPLVPPKAGTPKKPLALDSEGHIPPSPLLNPYVRETANELLDGQDVKQIRYPKLVPVAAALARKYGWEQGKFTPKEQVMLRETTHFIEKALRDNSMRALDEGTAARLKLQQVAQNPDKEGFIGRGFTLLASTNMTDSQKDFIQTYNQLVGTISGLAQLVRSGRATEATIERLRAELPNPSTTRDSRDAHERLKRLLDEINVAMKKGTFTGPQQPADAQSLINSVLNPGGK